jgi:hypothetical protein
MTSGIVRLQQLAAERKYDKTSQPSGKAKKKNNKKPAKREKRPWKKKERNQITGPIPNPMTQSSHGS